MIEDTGRARTFYQKNTQDVENAVMVSSLCFQICPGTSKQLSLDIILALFFLFIKSCPVNCMHFLSFDELKEMETSRDDGDGRTDHRHFGTGRVTHTPLHVAGLD